MVVSLIPKALAVWCGILVLAVANGGLREAVLVPKLGGPVAQVFSGLILSAVILGVAYLSLPWLGVRRRGQLLAIGLLWLLLTLLFEFSLGLWQGKSWGTMLEAYTFRGGNLWTLVLVVTAFAPLIAAKLKMWPKPTTHP